MRETIEGQVTSVRAAAGHFPWQQRWVMTVRDADGNKLQGTVPRGVNVKPGDHVALEATVNHQFNEFKNPRRFRHVQDHDRRTAAK